MAFTSIDVQACSVQDAAVVLPATQGKRPELHRKLLQAVVSSRAKRDAFTAMASVAERLIEPIAFHYFQSNADGRLALSWSFVARQSGAASRTAIEQLLVCCSDACREGRSRMCRLGEGGDYVAVAAPVFQPQAPSEAVAAVFSGCQQQAHDADAVLQLMSAHMMLWDLKRRQRETEASARAASSLLKLIERTSSCRSLELACQTLTNELQTLLGGRRAAVGIRRGNRGACRLRAISGLSRFDERSELTDAFESVLDEAILKNDVTVWPPLQDAGRHASQAHQRLCALVDCPSVISAPLRDEQGHAFAAWLLLAERELTQRPGIVGFVREIERPAAACLGVLQRAEPAAAARIARRFMNKRRRWRVKAALVAVCALAAVLCMPVGYKIGCDCRIEPVVRRFVAAPHEGTLEKSLVGSGDQVAEGQLLARMDGREIRWESAGLEADYLQAAKKRDAALANQNAAAAQLAKLEMERLQLNKKLLEHRANHLEIKSPIAGIVASGDLERAEGAPLAVGQTLFEIAPLDKMIAEVAVPEEQICDVRDGLEVVLRLDAYPVRTWATTLSRIQPRAEIREHQNVFIAEAILDNPDGLLRPGMNGRAKIVSSPRSLGWRLFHKPWESAAAWLGF